MRSRPARTARIAWFVLPKVANCAAANLPTRAGASDASHTTRTSAANAALVAIVRHASKRAVTCSWVGGELASATRSARPEARPALLVVGRASSERIPYASAQRSCNRPMRTSTQSRPLPSLLHSVSLHPSTVSGKHARRSPVVTSKTQDLRPPCVAGSAKSVGGSRRVESTG